ncbi:ribosome-recycling factor, chloroplastic [Iris pallida]|uniref:Ribosome-recycling factor, chloroplastic n=1 Tax=Iris pallida TaxID=29817 RepID=A0AAX6DI42_IRIPA|nr:ribosome-recycling factor, chloroplastic [Iris pallida]
MALQSLSTAAAARSLLPPTTKTTAPSYFSRAGGTGRARARSSAFSWRSAASYARLEASFAAASLPLPPLNKRRSAGGVFRCATIDEIEAEKLSIEKDAKERMEKTIESVRTNFGALRAGRASPSMLDLVEVEYYGTPVSLKSIAQISTPDASSILVQPYDKSSLKVIEKAIVSSNLGLTPNNDGEVIRLTVPQLTSERRKELTKVVAKQAEEGKVAIRNIRRDAIKEYQKLEKEKKLSEDNVKDLTSDLQKLTDEYMKKIESIQKQKEKVRHISVLHFHLDIIHVFHIPFRNMCCRQHILLFSLVNHKG